MRARLEASDKLATFTSLQPFLSGDRPQTTYAQIGVQLDMTEGAVKVAVHRLRARYGELLRSEIAKTVANSEDVDEELRYLIEVISR